MNGRLKLVDDIVAVARLNSNSRQPNYNFLLFQSDYLNYNWDNIDNFKTVQTQNLGFEIQSQKWLSASAEYSTIKNHTYFAQNDTGDVKPFQAGGTVDYLKLGVSKEFHLGKFSLDNTILYQQVLNGEGLFNVPELVSRHSFYFSDHIFKNAMFLQTGVTLNYFTRYHMDGYDPLLSEFYVQNEVSIGNFPRLDFFVNAKVRQTRIYVKAEHFNAALTGRNYFSAPNYPYRDFSIRFGLVWNFFL